MANQPTVNQPIKQYENATFSVKGSYLQTDGTLYDFTAYSAGQTMNDATKGLVEIWAYDSSGTIVSGYPQYAVRYATDSTHFILNVLDGLATAGNYTYKCWLKFTNNAPRLVALQPVQILSATGGETPP